MQTLSRRQTATGGKCSGGTRNYLREGLSLVSCLCCLRLCKAQCQLRPQVLELVLYGRIQDELLYLQIRQGRISVSSGTAVAGTGTLQRAPP